MQKESATEMLKAAGDHHRAGRLEKAETTYRQAIESDPSCADARLNLGIVLQDLGRLEEAGEILGRLVVDQPDLAAGWVQLARAIAPLGFAWEAHGAITKALKAKPDADTLVGISMLQVTLLQDISGAEATARRAVKMAPDNVSAWVQLGQIHSVKGKSTRAADAYRHALAIDPNNAVAKFYLAALSSLDQSVARSGSETAPPEYVRALFDGCAERFDEMLVGSLKYRTPQMLDAMFSQWLQRSGAATGPMVMLDAGCGTGLCGLWMARYRGRLIGVDLSRRMLGESKARLVYDELVPAEITQDLQNRVGQLDLIVAADVMVYIGDLSQVFAAASAALRPGGVFLFSVEATAHADYLLLPTQRFAHSLEYLTRMCPVNGFAIRLTEESVLRREKGKDIRGYLLLAEKLA